MKSKIYAFSLFTATAELLEFPDQPEGGVSVSVGMEPVKLNGKLANGKFLMPDVRTIEIVNGKVVKISPLSRSDISGLLKPRLK